MNTSDVTLKPSNGWRIFFIVVLLLALGLTLAPMGIMMWLHEVGVPFPQALGASPGPLVITFLLAALFSGIAALGAKNKKIFKYVLWVLLALAVANVSGCMMILKGLSNIH